MKDNLTSGINNESIKKIIDTLPLGEKFIIEIRPDRKGRPKVKGKKEKKPPQWLRILNLLKQGVRVSSALGNLHGIVQTTNRCCELRDDHGYDVKTDWACKNEVYFNEYYFTPGYIRELNKNATLPDEKTKK